MLFETEKVETFADAQDLLREIWRHENSKVPHLRVTIEAVEYQLMHALYRDCGKIAGVKQFKVGDLTAIVVQGSVRLSGDALRAFYDLRQVKRQVALYVPKPNWFDRRAGVIRLVEELAL